MCRYKLVCYVQCVPSNTKAHSAAPTHVSSVTDPPPSSPDHLHDRLRATPRRVAFAAARGALRRNLWAPEMFQKKGNGPHPQRGVSLYRGMSSTTAKGNVHTMASRARPQAATAVARWRPLRVSLRTITYTTSGKRRWRVNLRPKPLTLNPKP